MAKHRLMKTIAFLLFLVGVNSTFAQSTFTAKYFGLTVHPFGDPTANLQPNKWDSEARLVGNVGLFIGYEKFFYKDLVSAKVIQAVFSDCSAGLAGLTHIGLRVLALEHGHHRMYLAGGPTFIYRDSWKRFGIAYEESGFFRNGYVKGLGDVQYKFIWYGMELEYDYVFTERNSLSVSFTPGIPLAMILSVGWKHWFSTGEFNYDRPFVPRK